MEKCSHMLRPFWGLGLAFGEWAAGAGAGAGGGDGGGVTLDERPCLLTGCVLV